MTTAEDAVRARRKLTNKIIASHEALRLRPFLHPDVKLIAGDETLIQGADQVLEAFAAQFQERSFVAYIRTTEAVTIDQDGLRAAESGSWVGTWTSAAASSQSGVYLAVWRKSVGQWVIESELYVSLPERAGRRTERRTLLW